VLNGVGGEEILFCHVPSTIYSIMFLRNSGTFLLFGFPVYGFTVILNKLEGQKVNFCFQGIKISGCAKIPKLTLFLLMLICPRVWFVY